MPCKEDLADNLFLVLLEPRSYSGQFCDMTACGLKEEILHELMVVALQTLR